MTKDKSILIRNIYYMLSYAFTTLNQGGYLVRRNLCHQPFAVHRYV